MLSASVRMQAVVRGFIRRQTAFSVVSAVLPLMLVLVFVADLAIGHEGIERGMVSLWIALYSAMTALPLVLGRHFPKWAGLVLVAVLEGWSSYLLMFAGHGHAEFNALLELPMVALYIGWFYPGVIARVFIVLCVLRVSLTLVWNPGFVSDIASPFAVLGYAILIMVFCFEAARAVRKQVNRQAVTDSLTGAWNRRGLSYEAPKLERRAHKLGRGIAVAVVDFDDFKRVNDTGGHAAGDAALEESVRGWEAELGSKRPKSRDGLVARIGGDEFLLLRMGTAAELETMLANHRGVSQWRWSWGVVEQREGESIAAATVRADAEYYRLKRGGGSRQ